MGRAQKTGTKQGKSGNSATLGLEEKLWGAADKMRGHGDADEHKHVAFTRVHRLFPNLTPNGVAGVELPNGSLWSNQSGGSETRVKDTDELIEAKMS